MHDVRITLLPITVLAATRFAFAQSTVPTSYNLRDGSLGRAEIPEYLTTPTITNRTLPDGRKEIKLTFSQAFTPGSDKILIEAFFDSDSSTASRFDRVLAVALGSYTYLSNANLTPGTAGVINTSDQSKFATAEVVVSGNILHLRYQPSSVNNAAYYFIRLRCLPASIPLSNVSFGLQGVRWLKLFADPSIVSSTMFLPRVP